MNVRPKGIPEGRDCCNPWQKVMERIRAITEELSTTTKKIKVNGVTYTPVNEGVITLPDYPEPTPITIDTQLDETSTNAVQNKAIAIEVNSLDARVETTEDSIVLLEGLTQEQGEYITDLQGDVNDIETEIEETINPALVSIVTDITDNIKPDIEDLQTDLGTLSGSVEDIVEDVDDLQNDLATVTAAVSDLDTDKQDKLTAGTNITIDANNVISAAGGGTEKFTPNLSTSFTFYAGDYAAGQYITNLTFDKTVTYYLGVDPDIYDLVKAGKIGCRNGAPYLQIYAKEAFTLTRAYGSMFYRVDDNVTNYGQVLARRYVNIRWFCRASYEGAIVFDEHIPGLIEEKVAALESGKQDKLTAGTNITIDENNVISASGGGGGSGLPNVLVNYSSSVFSDPDGVTYTPKQFAAYCNSHKSDSVITVYDMDAKVFMRVTSGGSNSYVGLAGIDGTGTERVLKFWKVGGITGDGTVTEYLYNPDEKGKVYTTWSNVTSKLPDLVVGNPVGIAKMPVNTGTETIDILSYSGMVTTTGSNMTISGYGYGVKDSTPCVITKITYTKSTTTMQIYYDGVTDSVGVNNASMVVSNMRWVF